MKGQLLLIVAGVWVLAQVFGGDALGRLGIAGSGTTPATANSAPGSPSSSGGYTTGQPGPVGSASLPSGSSLGTVNV